jgi:hypothetical protein
MGIISVRVKIGWPHMIVRLRNLSSTKPIAINEYGTTSRHKRNISDIQLKTK